MNSFYVVLASNTKKAEGAVEANRQGNFLTRLPDILDFSEGEWTVGLASIIYPVSFIPDVMTEQWIRLEYFTPSKTPTDPRFGPKSDKKIMKFTDIPLFDDVDALQEYINTTLGNIKNVEGERSKRQIEPVPIGDEMDWGSGRRKSISPPPPPPPLPLDKLLKKASQHTKKASQPIKKPSQIENKLQQTVDTDNDYKRLTTSLHLVDVDYRKQVLALINESEKEIMSIKRHGIEINNLTEQRVTTFYLHDKMFERVERNYVEQNANKFDNFERNISNHQLPPIEKRVTEIKQRYIGPIKSEVQAYLASKNVEASEQLLAQVKNYVKELKETNVKLQEINYKIAGYEHELYRFKRLLNDWMRADQSDLDKVILDTIKEKLPKKLGKKAYDALDIYFYYVKEVNKFFIYNNKPDKITEIALSPAIAKTLGFEIEKNTNIIKNIRLAKGGGFASHFPDIDPGVRQIYVYMPDIIEDSFVGDSKSPLLRVINVDKPSGSWAENVYTLEYHHRIIQKRINSIRLTLHSGSGNEVRFASGNVIVILHFRKNYF